MMDVVWHVCEYPACNFKTIKPARLDRHAKFHTSRDRKYVCCDCGQQFVSLQKCLKHDRKLHTGVREWECPVCLIETTDILVHMKVHENKRHKCDICDHEFRHKSSLTRHRYQHTSRDTTIINMIFQ
ncbi:zinc finger and SCAN domain-containing protein 10 [Eurytemora carolleeae]|uniref:zinc finger and SCAN domain-containing protein 10 n=1 Tax=Eurytemora carolleeae TaxID=1294199 RepID=UPI000C7755A6|nr:zinc finger and SCAN domain-containing protein 10 [Eurytemora carolleeae]|eukprot:XP_023324460.1 zinc finger and SCAN domain-containing protein 10-like [Eurytemora affinis]